MPKWTVQELKYATTDGGVVTVDWQVESDPTNIQGQPYVETSPGQSDFEYDASSPDFVPYESLTEDIVLSWVWDESVSGINKAQIEQQLLDGLPPADPESIVSGLPWE